MTPGSDLSSVRALTYGVQGLPQRDRKKDDRDDRFRRQMKDIEEEEGRIHEHSVLDAPEAPPPVAPNAPRSIPPEGDDKHHINVEA